MTEIAKDLGFKVHEGIYNATGGKMTVYKAAEIEVDEEGNPFLTEKYLK